MQEDSGFHQDFIVGEGADQGNYLAQEGDCFWNNHLIQDFQIQNPTFIEAKSLRRKIRLTINGHSTHSQTYELLKN